MIDVSVEVDDKEVYNLLLKLQGRTSSASMRMFLRNSVLTHLRERIGWRFSNEGDSASGTWAQLTEATGRIRATRGFSPFHPINVRTGAMKNFAMTSYRISAIGTGGAELTLPGSNMTTLMRSKIAMAQQGGSAKKRGRSFGPNRPAPPRPIYALDAIDEEIISSRLLDWIRVGGPGVP